MKWLASTIGKRGYIARYLRESLPDNSSVIGTGNDPYTPGFASCDSAFVMPSIRNDGYLSAVLALCKQEKIDAMITLSDLDIRAISGLRPQLCKMNIACFFPGEAIATRFLNKLDTFRYLSTNGFLTPRTFDNLEEAKAHISGPLVIKPRMGSASNGVSFLDDFDGADAAWKAIEGPIVQEFVSGRLINVEACSDTEGQLLAMSVWERHSSVAGETLLAETIEHAEAVALVTHLLSESPIPGPVDLDLIETKDGIYVLEVNTRFGGGYPVSHLAGANFTGAMIGSLKGERPERLDKYQRGITMIKDLNPIILDHSHVSRDSYS